MKRQNLAATERLNQAAMKLCAPFLDTRPGALRVTLPPNPSAMQWCEFAFAIEQHIAAGYPADAILRDNRDSLAAFVKVDEMRHDALMRALGAR